MYRFPWNLGKNSPQINKNESRAVQQWLRRRGWGGSECVCVVGFRVGGSQKYLSNSATKMSTYMVSLVSMMYVKVLK